MAQKKEREKKQNRQIDASSRAEEHSSYCSLHEVPKRVFGPNIDANRAALINVMSNKWVNGTELHYYFFDQESDGEHVYSSDGTNIWNSWTANENQKAVVRKAFDFWKDVGIGLKFKEVDSRDDAEIRIGFMQRDGAWSYIGRYILNIGSNKRTMNFGWDLTRHSNEIDTAVHEIGHTLGFPHEHQNPNAGIIWNEEAVYAALASPPNNWSREKTHYNIIRKIDPDRVQGSNWDPNSIMHYPFERGLIREPHRYSKGLNPEPGLSARDEAWVRSFYPALESDEYPELKPFQSEKLNLFEGQQSNFTIRPNATRYYQIQSFGTSDTVMELFEDENGDLRYRTADDDSGQDYNANINVKLFKGRKYVLRIRLYYSNRTAETAIMMW